MKLTLSELPSPQGAMLLVTDDRQRVRALDFADRRTRLHRGLREQYGAYELAEGEAPLAVADALRRYFAGDLAAIESIEVATAGTPAQELAWAALRRIPAGTIATYAEIGRAMGITDWRAAVDAGAAVGANPIAIIVPCHRVIAANGDLKGYAWGLHRKQWLLEHEKALQARPAMPETVPLF